MYLTINVFQLDSLEQPPLSQHCIYVIISLNLRHWSPNHLPPYLLETTVLVLEVTFTDMK